MNDVAEVRLVDQNGNPAGIGRIWEPRPGKFSWAHPNGSEGVNCQSFEEAEKELELAGLDERNSPLASWRHRK